MRTQSTGRLLIKLLGLSVTVGLLAFGAGHTGQGALAQSAKPADLCGDVVYSEDFSNSKSGWFVGADSQGFDWGYSNGEYRVLSSLPGFIAFSLAPNQTPAGNFCLEVGAKQVVQGSLSNQGELGLFFGADFKNPRARATSFYGLVFPGGGFDIGTFGSQTGAKHLAQGLSSAIKPVNEFNHLVIIVKDGQAGFYVNDTFLVTQGVPASGNVGIFVATLQAPNTNGRFDNFVIRSLK